MAATYVKVKTEDQQKHRSSARFSTFCQKSRLRLLCANAPLPFSQNSVKPRPASMMCPLKRSLHKSSHRCDRDIRRRLRWIPGISDRIRFANCSALNVARHGENGSRIGRDRACFRDCKSAARQADRIQAVFKRSLLRPRRRIVATSAILLAAACHECHFDRLRRSTADLEGQPNVSANHGWRSPGKGRPGF